MKKSTRNLIIGIGILSILSSIYGFSTNSDLFDNLFGLFIGASLIGSIYFDKYSKAE